MSLFLLLNINETKNQINSNSPNIGKDDIIKFESYKKFYDKLLSKIKKYNPEIKSETLSLVLNIIEQHSLSKNHEETLLLVSQILCESGFQQFYHSKHKKSGVLVKSYANAIGISQITPNTAYFYLRKAKNKNEIHYFNNVNFAKSFTKHKPNKKQKVQLEKWLETKENNIKLWGYIMKNLRQNNSLEESFVAYNAGSGFLKKFLSKKSKTENFPYVKKIREIKKGF